MSTFKYVSLAIVLFFLTSIVRADDVFDLQAVQDQAIMQITIDLDTITDVPEGSSAEFMRDLFRNKHITAYYAELYLSNPEQFQWAGLAAYVSNEVGNQLGIFQEAGLAGVFTTEYQTIVDANIAVYADIYWQYQAYRQFGLVSLEQAYADELITDSILESWRFLDQQNVDESVVLLAEFEQGVILQDALYDPLFEFFAGFLSTTSFESPIPDHDAPFEGDNIADFDQRWDWTVNMLLPGWSNFQDEQPDRIRDDFLTFMLNTENDDVILMAIELVCQDYADCITMILETCDDDTTVACLQSRESTDDAD